MILLLLIFLVLLWTIHFRYKRRRLYELAAKLPAMPGENPVIGHAYQFMGDTEHIMSLLQKYSHDAMKLGGLSRLWLNHILFTKIVDSVDIERVTKTCIEKNDILWIARVFLGNGIVFAPASIWRTRRKTMVSALSPKYVASLIDVFASTSKILTDKMESECGTGEFSIWSYVIRYALDSICETSLGIKLNSQEDSNVPFLNALNSAQTIISERMFHVWYQPDWLFKLFRGKYREQEKSRRTMFNFIDEIISNKLSEDDLKTSASFSLYDQTKYQTILKYLINVYGGEKGYNNVEIREELLSIIVAGTDTTAVAICNTLVLLTKYPEVQKRVHQELSTVFGNSVQQLVKEDLSKLVYLERVIKESLRLFPPVPIISRKISNETLLPSGYVLPAGSSTMLDIWGAHRDPKYWGPNADHFDPDRFLPERYHLPHPCSYMPFSTGSRNCIGYQYAIMSLKVALSSILRRYKVVSMPEQGPIPRMRMKMDVTMKAVDGYQITLEKNLNTH